MTSRSFPDRETIRRHQLAQLRRLLDAVATSNPFYAPILKQAGLDGQLPSLDAFHQKMPLTTKDAIVDDQQRHPPYGTNLTHGLEAYCRFNQTSSTTGSPIRWLDTPESWQWMVDNWKQIFEAAGIDAADRLLFAFSFGPFLGFWTAFDAATQCGCLCIPGGGWSSLARLQALQDHRATVLLCTPTYALRLAEVAQQQQIDLAALAVRTILVAGEPGGSVPSIRAQLEHHWCKAKIFDHHGMTEVGPVSYQCPQQPGTLVVIERAYLAEILEPDGERPVRRGAVGELVLTTLGRLSAPLIRYRTGDLVQEDTEIGPKTGQPQLALRGGILGRTDDMVLVRGVNVYPSAVEQVIRSLGQIAEFRVEVTQRGPLAELHVTVEPTPDCGEHEMLARRAEANLRASFNLRVPVSVCPPGTLPRFEMKARRWVRK